MAGTPGGRYIVKMRYLIEGHGKRLNYEQIFHLARLESYRLEMTDATDAFQILDKKVLAATTDFAFLYIRADVEGVDWWFVNSATPTVSSSVVGAARVLRPSEFVTDVPFSISSLPAVVFSNDSGQTANISIVYGAYV